MSFFDVVLIIIISGFAFYGLFAGLIKSVGSIVGLLGGFWIAIFSNETVFSWFDYMFFGSDRVGKVVIFILVFAVTNRLICFLFALLDEVFDIVSIIPFLKTINRLLGALLGFILGSLTVGLVLYGIARYPVLYKFFESQMTASQVAPRLIKLIQSILPFLPDLIDRGREWSANSNIWKAEFWENIDFGRIWGYRDRLMFWR